MIIFFENGRLGNQLLQYVGLKHFFAKEKFIFFGCENLPRHFENVDGRFVFKSAIDRWIPFYLFNRVVLLLVKARIFGLISEDQNSNSYKLLVRRGLFWNILVPQNVFFQHSDVIGSIQALPALKAQLAERARSWLIYKGVDPKSNSLVFVHVRRGDYLHWPSKEFPAVLNASWYKRAMKKIQEDIDKPVFVLMSDDQHYVRDIFEESDMLIISNNSPEIDLAIMAVCQSGILSASSFAWCGAFYARTQGDRIARFIAPKYWVGHLSKKWYPSGVRTNWLTYIE